MSDNFDKLPASLLKSLKVFGLSLENALRWSDVHRDVDVCELWAGVCSVASAAETRDLQTVCLDIALNSEDDVTTLTGFRRALRAVQRLRRGGLLVMGPTCSSFVFMNSSKCKRSSTNDFEGDTSYEQVHAGNLQADVAGFIFLYAFCRGVIPVLENPPASNMWNHGVVKLIPEAVTPLYTSETFRCAFAEDGSFRKPYKFISSDPFIMGVTRACRCTKPHAELATRLEGGRVRGKPAALKESAGYPKGLGECIVALWLASESDSDFVPAVRPSQRNQCSKVLPARQLAAASSSASESDSDFVPAFRPSQRNQRSKVLPVLSSSRTSRQLAAASSSARWRSSSTESESQGVSRSKRCTAQATQSRRVKSKTHTVGPQAWGDSD